MVVMVWVLVVVPAAAAAALVAPMGKAEQAVLMIQVFFTMMVAAGAVMAEVLPVLQVPAVSEELVGTTISPPAVARRA